MYDISNNEYYNRAITYDNDHDDDSTKKNKIKLMIIHRTMK